MSKTTQPQCSNPKLIVWEHSCQPHIRALVAQYDPIVPADTIPEYEPTDHLAPVPAAIEDYDRRMADLELQYVSQIAWMQDQGDPEKAPDRVILKTLHALGIYPQLGIHTPAPVRDPETNEDVYYDTSWRQVIKKQPHFKPPGTYWGVTRVPFRARGKGFGEYINTIEPLSEPPYRDDPEAPAAVLDFDSSAFPYRNAFRGTKGCYTKSMPYRYTSNYGVTVECDSLIDDTVLPPLDLGAEPEEYRVGLMESPQGRVARAACHDVINYITGGAALAKGTTPDTHHIPVIFTASGGKSVHTHYMWTALCGGENGNPLHAYLTAPIVFLHAVSAYIRGKQAVDLAASRQFQITRAPIGNYAGRNQFSLMARHRGAIPTHHAAYSPAHVLAMACPVAFPGDTRTEAEVASVSDRYLAALNALAVVGGYKNFASFWKDQHVKFEGQSKAAILKYGRALVSKTENKGLTPLRPWLLKVCPELAPTKTRVSVAVPAPVAAPAKRTGGHEGGVEATTKAATIKTTVVKDWLSGMTYNGIPYDPALKVRVYPFARGEIRSKVKGIAVTTPSVFTKLCNEAGGREEHVTLALGEVAMALAIDYNNGYTYNHLVCSRPSVDGVADSTPSAFLGFDAKRGGYMLFDIFSEMSVRPITPFIGESCARSLTSTFKRLFRYIGDTTDDNLGLRAVRLHPAAPGAGKSGTIQELVRGWWMRGEWVLYVAPSRALLRDTERRLKSQGIPYVHYKTLADEARAAAKSTQVHTLRTGNPVVLTTAQSLHKFLGPESLLQQMYGTSPKFARVVIDEYGTVMQQFAAASAPIWGARSASLCFEDLCAVASKAASVDVLEGVLTPGSAAAFVKMFQDRGVDVVYPANRYLSLRGLLDRTDHVPLDRLKVPGNMRRVHVLPVSFIGIIQHLMATGKRVLLQEQNKTAMRQLALAFQNDTQHNTQAFVATSGMQEEDVILPTRGTILANDTRLVCATTLGVGVNYINTFDVSAVVMRPSTSAAWLMQALHRDRSCRDIIVFHDATGIVESATTNTIADEDATLHRFVDAINLATEDVHTNLDAIKYELGQQAFNVKDGLDALLPLMQMCGMNINAEPGSGAAAGRKARGRAASALVSNRNKLLETSKKYNRMRRGALVMLRGTFDRTITAPEDRVGAALYSRAVRLGYTRFTDLDGVEHDVTDPITTAIRTYTMNGSGLKNIIRADAGVRCFIKAGADDGITAEMKSSLAMRHLLEFLTDTPLATLYTHQFSIALKYSPNVLSQEDYKKRYAFLNVKKDVYEERTAEVLKAFRGKSKVPNLNEWVRDAKVTRVQGDNLLRWMWAAVFGSRLGLHFSKRHQNMVLHANVCDAWIASLCMAGGYGAGYSRRHSLDTSLSAIMDGKELIVPWESCVTGPAFHGFNAWDDTAWKTTKGFVHSDGPRRAIMRALSGTATVLYTFHDEDNEAKSIVNVDRHAVAHTTIGKIRERMDAIESDEEEIAILRINEVAIDAIELPGGDVFTRGVPEGTRWVPPQSWVPAYRGGDGVDNDTTLNFIVPVGKRGRPVQRQWGTSAAVGRRVTGSHRAQRSTVRTQVFAVTGYHPPVVTSVVALRRAPKTAPLPPPTQWDEADVQF